MMMDAYKYKLTNRIVNYGLLFIALISVPLNIIVFFAIRQSQCLLIRSLPVFLSILVILLYFKRDQWTLDLKIRTLTSLLFATGLFTLLLGLIDMASLWFILAIIFSLFDEKKKLALITFILALVFTIITGILMIIKNPNLPIDYGFDDCQFACVTIRILNFLTIGFLIFKILRMFLSTIELYINELIEKNRVLQLLQIAEQNEAKEKINNQILKSNMEKQDRENWFKQQELTNALSKIIRFNTVLNLIKQQISEKNYTDALTSIRINLSNNYNFDRFIEQFEDLNANFVGKLKAEHPQLSEKDIHLCIFIISGLKSAEIAELMNITEPSVAKYRNRLRKKLKLENNTDLVKYLSNFYQA